jgi:hypothetical protein
MCDTPKVAAKEMGGMAQDNVGAVDVGGTRGMRGSFVKGRRSR